MVFTQFIVHYQYSDKKIASIDPILEKNEKIIKKLSEYRSCLISAAVNRKLNIKEVSYGK